MGRHQVTKLNIRKLNTEEVTRSRGMTSHNNWSSASAVGRSGSRGRGDVTGWRHRCFAPTIDKDKGGWLHGRGPDLTVSSSPAQSCKCPSDCPSTKGQPEPLQLLFKARRYSVALEEALLCKEQDKASVTPQGHPLMLVPVQAWTKSLETQHSAKSPRTTEQGMTSEH